MDTNREKTRGATIERLLIVRLGSMGDIIHTLPAATVLSQAFPNATLGWVVEERWAELLCTLPTPRSGPRSAQRPLINRLHIVNTKRWRSSLLSLHTWEQIGAALSDVRAVKYQVAVDFQGAIRSALIAKMSRAPVLFGFSQTRESEASMFYSQKVLSSGTHIVEQNLSLASAVVRRFTPAPDMEFPHDAAAEREIECWLNGRGLHGFVIINPGAGWGAKRWPAEYYGELARSLAGQGCRVVVNAGPGEEQLADAVVLASGGAAIGFSGSLAKLIVLTRRARLFIGGDTGPMHLAAALKVPVVAIFGPTNPARNGPYGTRAVVLRSKSSVTSHSRRERTEEGLFEISVEQVIDAAQELLGSDRG